MTLKEKIQNIKGTIQIAADCGRRTMAAELHAMLEDHEKLEAEQKASESEKQNKTKW